MNLADVIRQAAKNAGERATQVDYSPPTFDAETLSNTMNDSTPTGNETPTFETATPSTTPTFEVAAPAPEATDVTATQATTPTFEVAPPSAESKTETVPEAKPVAAPAPAPKKAKAQSPKVVEATPSTSEAVAFTQSEEDSHWSAFDAITAEPVTIPEAPSGSTRTGNVVRLELFLSPDQLSSLFRALVATQHGMMTLREAANYLRVHPSTVEQMAIEGTLPALMIEGRWRFPKSSLDEWLNIQVFRSRGESDAA